MEFREFVADCLASESATAIEDTVDGQSIPEWVQREERLQNQVLFFKNVTGYQAGMVANLFGDRQRICRVVRSEGMDELYRKVEAAISHPVTLQQQSWSDMDYTVLKTPDIARVIPAIQYSRADATPYLTSGIVVAADPESGRVHFCFVRLSLQPDNVLLFNAATATIAGIVEKTLAGGRDLEVLILIGPPVEIILAACLSVPTGTDKLQLAQALGGERLIFSRDRLPIPLGTEYILQGRVMAEYRREGPFGDMKGLYSIKERNPICRIDEIRIRQNPLYHAISAGTAREHTALVSLGPGFRLYRLVQEHEGIIRSEIPTAMSGRMAVITVREGFDVGTVLDDLWLIPIIRLFVFVNEDVDDTCPADLFWALIQRTQGATDFFFTDRASGVMKETKFAIDATATGLTEWAHRRVQVYRG
jgi:2,5-furandicarboxylate decarboxylase 1